MSLRPEQDARLLAATDRMWMCRNDPAQVCVQPACGDTGLPASQRFGDRSTKAINMTASQCGEIDLGCPLELDQLALDWLASTTTTHTSARSMAPCVRKLA